MRGSGSARRKRIEKEAAVFFFAGRRRFRFLEIGKNFALLTAHGRGGGRGLGHAGGGRHDGGASGDGLHFEGSLKGGERRWEARRSLKLPDEV